MKKHSEKPTIFLDRDGVINLGTPGYIKTWEEFVFEDGALDALKKLHEAGFRLIVVTNQSGINRGLYRLEDVEDIHRRMIEEIRRHGGDIDAIYVCPHAPGEDCECRKPRAGLLHQAAVDYGVRMKESWMIGDKPRDIAAGKSAGCRTIFIEDGTDAVFEFNETNTPDLSFPKLREAAEFLVGEVAGRV